MIYRYALPFPLAPGKTDADARSIATYFRAMLGLRKLAAAAAVCYVLALPTSAQAANWNAGIGQCSSGSISISTPTAWSTTTNAIWWYPEIYVSTAAGWIVAYSPGYFFATQAGAIGSVYQAWQGGNVVGMDRPLIVPVTPGRYYAVHNWLYDGGWAEGWSLVEYPTNTSLSPQAYCPVIP